MQTEVEAVSVQDFDSGKDSGREQGGRGNKPERARFWSLTGLTKRETEKQISLWNTLTTATSERGMVWARMENWSPREFESWTDWERE